MNNIIIQVEKDLISYTTRKKNKRQNTNDNILITQGRLSDKMDPIIIDILKNIK